MKIAGRARVLVTFALATLAVGVISFVALDVWGRIQTSKVADQLKRSRAHWTRALQAELPIGTSKAGVEAWLARTLPRGKKWTEPSFDVAARTYAATVDDIPERGPVVACSDWMVVVTISLGPDDRVTGRDVSTSGVCL